MKLCEARVDKVIAHYMGQNRYQTFYFWLISKWANVHLKLLILLNFSEILYIKNLIIDGMMKYFIKIF